MREVMSDDLECGMVVDEDVKDRSGRLLMPAGTELTDKHIRILKTWGILSLKILCAEEQDTHQDELLKHLNNLESPLFTQAQDLINKRFRHNSDISPAITEIKRLCLLKELSRLIKSEVSA